MYMHLRLEHSNIKVTACLVVVEKGLCCDVCTHSHELMHARLRAHMHVMHSSCSCGYNFTYIYIYIYILFGKSIRAK